MKKKGINWQVITFVAMGFGFILAAPGGILILIGASALFVAWVLSE